MSHFFNTKKIVYRRAFTLLETLASIAIVSTVILGPLTVAINSSAYSRQTKDVMTSTYLAEESLELLRHQYDSLLLRCQQQPAVIPCDTLSDPQEIAQPSRAAWRIFKERLGSEGVGTNSCFTVFNAKGCSFDFIDFSYATDTPTKYRAGDTGVGTCSSLALTKSADKRHYTCADVSGHGLGILLSKVYTRSVTVESLPTPLDGPAGLTDRYNDDLRITATIGFKRPNGSQREIKVVDYFHAKP
jgi:type II secretory pathway pseudopilin PulG